MPWAKSVYELREIGSLVLCVQLAVELPVLLGKLEDVLFVPVTPGCRSSLLLVELVTQLLRIRAVLDEPLQLLLVLLAVLLVLVGVVGLQAYR